MLQALFSQEALLFTIPALLGTAVFLIRLGLMTIVGLDHDVDVPHDVDIPHDVAIDAHGDVHANRVTPLQRSEQLAQGIVALHWGTFHEGALGRDHAVDPGIAEWCVRTSTASATIL